MIDRLPPMVASRIEVADCWLWVGATRRDGYGQIELREDGARRAWLAHRLVYSLLVGDPGENLHHRETCPKRCVNPEHLTPLSAADHTAHHHEKQDRCHRGHDLSDAYVIHRSDGRVTRQCRPCQLERVLARKRALREAPPG